MKRRLVKITRQEAEAAANEEAAAETATAGAVQQKPGKANRCEFGCGSGSGYRSSLLCPPLAPAPVAQTRQV